MSLELELFARPRVWNKRDPRTPEDAVYVGRPSVWGNPWSIGKDGTREQVVQKYRDMVLSTGWSGSIKQDLRGKHLVCWCAPLACHADVLLEIANS